MPTIAKGDYEKAIESFGKSLAIMFATLGENHPNTTATYMNMGSAFHSKGDYDRALESYGKSLAAWPSDSPHWGIIISTSSPPT